MGVPRGKKLRVFERDRYECKICFRQTNPDVIPPDPQAPTVDHIIAKSRGGPDRMQNLRTAHFSCNQKRENDTDVREWNSLNTLPEGISFQKVDNRATP